MNAAAPVQLAELKLKRHEDQRIRSGHAWVFSNEIDTSSTPLQAVPPGSACRIVDSRGRFLAHALINPHALICGRVLSTVEAEPIAAALFATRIRQALAMRERYVGGVHYRLIYGESDGLPGLVVDRFGDILVGQINTLAMELRRDEIAAALQATLAPTALIWKNDSGARDLESLPQEVSVAFGTMPAQLQVLEGGLKFEVSVADSQKTGWYFDQTANRVLMRQFLKPGARVLDVCSYVGAWAVSALAYGAASALCVDASQNALEAATRNAERNGLSLAVRRGDAFDVLEALHQEGQQFDMVIVDPPAFIKRRKDLPKGEAAYRKLNQLAMRLCAQSATLISCSCSWHLPSDTLPTLLQAGANHLGRGLRIIAQGGQSPDHPVHPAMPETRYLKALFTHVYR
jgi:23S rRNA (cytosine1962-C5)-methyltransferase